MKYLITVELTYPIERKSFNYADQGRAHINEYLAYFEHSKNFDLRQMQIL